MALQSSNQTLPSEIQYSGIENRNFLSPVGFKLSIDKLRGVDFFCQSASIPAINLGVADTYTRFNKIPQPGDELDYQELQLSFLIDENMKNWYQVHDWMREIATPKSSKEFQYKRGEVESDNPNTKPSDLSTVSNQWRSDCSLFILSSNYQPVAEFIFRDAWPTSLSTLNFDASIQDLQYFTAQVSLKYTYYDYYIRDAAEATDASMNATYRVSEQGVTLS